MLLLTLNVTNDITNFSVDTIMSKRSDSDHLLRRAKTINRRISTLVTPAVIWDIRVGRYVSVNTVDFLTFHVIFILEGSIVFIFRIKYRLNEGKCVRTINSLVFADNEVKNSWI